MNVYEAQRTVLAGIAVFNYVRCIPHYHMMLFYTNLMPALSSMVDIPYLVGKLLFILENSLHTHTALAPGHIL